MRAYYPYVLFLFLLPGMSLAQSATAGAQASNSAASTPAPQLPGSQLQSGTLIYAELNKSIDSRKAKVGDPVQIKVTQAVLSHGEIAIPKGSKIVAHLTEAKASSKEQPQAELAIALDKAVLKDRTEVPLNSATIQAIEGVNNIIGPDQSMGGTSGGADQRGSDRGGMPGLPGYGGTPGANSGMGSASPMGQPSPNVGPAASGSDSRSGAPRSSAPLTANSHGVIGMPGVTLSITPNLGSVLVANGKNVKLDSGTQLVLRVQ